MDVMAVAHPCEFPDFAGCHVVMLENVLVFLNTGVPRGQFIHAE